MVSKPRNSNSSKFFTDAIINTGISGSPMLAIRDGVPNFEMAGMASSTSAKSIDNKSIAISQHFRFIRHKFSI